MNYYEQQENLEKFLKKAPGLKESPIQIIDKVNRVGDLYELTFEEIGYLYDEVRKVLSNESPMDKISDNIGPNIASSTEIDQISEGVADIINQIQNPLYRPKTQTSSEPAEKVVSDISSKLQLNGDQKSSLMNLVQNALKDKSKISSFRSDLVNGLGITYDQALKVSFEINSRIFSGSTSDLRKTEGSGNFGRPGQKETRPDHMIPDHEQMEKVDGIHLHSQSVMPSINRTPQPQAQSSRISNPAPTVSIIDQKLGGMTRSESSPPANLPTNQKPAENVVFPEVSKEKYKGKDPYREPIE